ncbi:hypothetical protein ACWCV5_34355 [Streptomyces tubercidicus]
MVQHLHSKVAAITDLADVGPDDLVVDIGSNDSTVLRGYPTPGPTLVGIDPTGRPAAPGRPRSGWTPWPRSKRSPSASMATATARVICSTSHARRAR